MTPFDITKEFTGCAGKNLPIYLATFLGEGKCTESGALERS